MGATTSTIASALLTTALQAPIQNQIRWDSTLIHLLPVKNGMGAGINFTVEFTGQSNGAAAAETATYALSDADNEDGATFTLGWAKYDKTAAVTGLAASIAASNVTPQSLLGNNNSLLANRAKQAFQRLLRGVAVHAYSGQSGQTPAQVVGAATSIDSTGSYGGIDPGTYTEWVSAENTGNLSALSFDMIRRSLVTPIFEASGMLPDVILTTSTIFDRVINLFGSNTVPYLDKIAVRDGNGGQREVVLAAGGNAVMVDGIPILRDRDCTSGVMYGVNFDHIELQQLPHAEFANFMNPAAIEALMREAVGSAEAARISSRAYDEMAGFIRNPRGIVPFFKVLGASGDQDLVMATTMLQFAVNRRNAHGKLVLS